MDIRNRVRELRQVTAGELAANPRNFRKHPRAQRDALAGLLADIGIAGALLAYYSEAAGGALTLVDGHLRRETAPDTAWPVLILDVDDREAALLLATLDPLAALAQTDGAALHALLHEVESTDAAVQALLSDLYHDAEDAALTARETPAEDSGGNSMTGTAGMVKIAIACEDLAPVEAALAASGERNRAAALVIVARAYLEQSHAPEGQ